MAAFEPLRARRQREASGELDIGSKQQHPRGGQKTAGKGAFGRIVRFTIRGLQANLQAGGIRNGGEHGRAGNHSNAEPRQPGDVPQGSHRTASGMGNAVGLKAGARNSDASGE